MQGLRGASISASSTRSTAHWAAHPIRAQPYEPPPHFERKLALPAPVDNVEALGFGVNRLVSELAGWLLARGLGVVRMSLALVHERYVRERGTPPSIATFALGAPARAPAHLHAVLRERLARVTLPAPVEAIVLTSDETAPLAGRNLGLLPEDEADASSCRSSIGCARGSATTSSPCSPRSPSIVPNTRRPRRLPAYAVRPPRSGARPLACGRRTARARRAFCANRPSVSAPADAPRPLWLLDEAKILSGVLEATPWILRDGPERIESGWWDGRDFRRDYFVAETPHGGIVWIYRDHRYGTDDGEWFMHGVFA